MKQPLLYAKRRKANASGYAMVVLLVFVIMAMTLMSAAVNIMLVATQTSSVAERSEMSLANAESGVEEALLRAIRNPSYTGGTLTIGGDSVTIVVSGGSIKTITSRSSVANVGHGVTVTADYSGATLVIPSWRITF